MKRKTIIVLVALLLCARPAYSYIYFNDGQTHNIDYSIDEYVRVDYQRPAMYTTVNLLDGGILWALSGSGDSRINVLGGSTDYLSGYDSCQINISGGSITNRVYSEDSSQVNISGGSIGSHIRSGGSSQVDISGGSIGYILTWHSCQIDISGGSLAYI